MKHLLTTLAIFCYTAGYSQKQEPVRIINYTVSKDTLCIPATAPINYVKVDGIVYKIVRTTTLEVESATGVLRSSGSGTIVPSWPGYTTPSVPYLKDY